MTKKKENKVKLDPIPLTLVSRGTQIAVIWALLGAYKIAKPKDPLVKGLQQVLDISISHQEEHEEKFNADRMKRQKDMEDRAIKREEEEQKSWKKDKESGALTAGDFATGVIIGLGILAIIGLIGMIVEF